VEVNPRYEELRAYGDDSAQQQTDIAAMRAQIEGAKQKKK
jgi:hypothetical protein